ncbi:MAG TPA: hypothetical protein VHX61_16015 [Rhizomicrobium sp.]|jgi:hypothetical protein|nr:hypothetical protein [Rhizomicrobium sp.]
MAKLLENALQAVDALPEAEQDEIARVIMRLANADDQPPVLLTQAEREAIARSKSAAERGEFATDEQVRAVWSSRGL